MELRLNIRKIHIKSEMGITESLDLVEKITGGKEVMLQESQVVRTVRCIMTLELQLIRSMKDQSL